MKLFFVIWYIILAFIIHCTAHWTEGNTNYLIGKVFSNDTKKSSYRCLAYNELHTSDSSFNNRLQRHDPDFIDLSSPQNGKTSKTTLQIHISQDEFCRNIDNVIDEQFSYSFTKVFGSETHIAPKISSSNSRFNRHLTNRMNNSSVTIRNKPSRYSRFNSCKFPRWLNKKWRNLKQTKQFMLDYRLDSLLVSDEKNSVIINRYTCEKMRSRRSKSVQAVVKSLNGW